MCKWHDTDQTMWKVENIELQKICMTLCQGDSSSDILHPNLTFMPIIITSSFRMRVIFLSRMTSSAWCACCPATLNVWLPCSALVFFHYKSNSRGYFCFTEVCLLWNGPLGAHQSPLHRCDVIFRGIAWRNICGRHHPSVMTIAAGCAELTLPQC